MCLIHQENRLGERFVRLPEAVRRLNDDDLHPERFDALTAKEFRINGHGRPRGRRSTAAYARSHAPASIAPGRTCRRMAASGGSSSASNSPRESQYRDVEDLLVERGLDTSHESVRCWFLKFGASITRNLHHMRPTPSNSWHLDEMVIVIRERCHWLWRAVDNEGEVLDFLV